MPFAEPTYLGLPLWALANEDVQKARAEASRVSRAVRAGIGPRGGPRLVPHLGWHLGAGLELVRTREIQIFNENKHHEGPRWVLLT